MFEWEDGSLWSKDDAIFDYKRKANQMEWRGMEDRNHRIKIAYFTKV